MPRISAEDSRLLKLLLTPSWLSGLVVVMAGLTISVGVIVAFEAHNSVLQQQLVSWEQTLPQPALTTPGQAVPQNNNRPTAQNSWTLLLLWSLVGLLVYGLVATMVHSIARAEGLRESLKYVHANPRTMLASTAQHLLLRSIAAVTLAGFAVAFLEKVVPYGITAAYASAADVMSLDGGLYALLSFALIAVSLHLMTILLRLALGRVRVFS
jgi:hypothetical protein